MSDETVNKNNSSPYCSNSGFMKHMGRVLSSKCEDEISAIVSDIIEITCKNLPEKSFNRLAIVEFGVKKPNDMNILCTTDKQKKCSEQKLEDGNLPENDMPVRRSNRIRKTVVKKDEFISPRSKKTNKNNKSEVCNTKVTHPENKSLEFDKNVCEASGKIPEKILKNKGTKSPKVEKPKTFQSGKRSTQSEKKKTTQKKKKSNKAEDATDSISSDYESKKDEKSENVLLESTASSDASINSENSKSVIVTKLTDKPDDQNCEKSEKPVESCNIKPVKVKSRWWRSSELEAVKNSETNTNYNVNLVTVKTEPVETPLVSAVENSMAPVTIKMEPIELPSVTAVKEEIPSEIKLEAKK